MRRYVCLAGAYNKMQGCTPLLAIGAADRIILNLVLFCTFFPHKIELWLCTPFSSIRLCADRNRHISFVTAKTCFRCQGSHFLGTPPPMCRMGWRLKAKMGRCLGVPACGGDPRDSGRVEHGKDEATTKSAPLNVVECGRVGVAELG